MPGSRFTSSVSAMIGKRRSPKFSTSNVPTMPIRLAKLIGRHYPTDPHSGARRSPVVYSRAVRAEYPPLPPLELAARVGGTHADAYAGYEEFGEATRREIIRHLPADWSFADKRVLDFGCGAGRTLRHFLGEAAEGSVAGCDIDVASIDWLEAHLSPPLKVFVAPDTPPLPLPEGELDLVWAISVFTHLTDTWSSWLAEIHRVLRDDGLLLATFIGPGAASWVTTEPWVEEGTGMNVLRYGQPWSLGGPMVMHSEWWLREHWGRAFEIVTLERDGFATSNGGQGIVLMRKRPGAVSAPELERIAPDDTREIAALRHQVGQIHRESLEARTSLAWLEGEHLRLAERLAATRKQRFRRFLRSHMP
ncbi:MAG: class I SAM-dependent methyltransferase [Thermoleophilia bacterium]|nr:class I SAM-dependent methyltransferase [Thermoleophilia bacterium]